MHFSEAGEMFSTTSLRRCVPAGTARKSWGTGGFLRSSFPGKQGKDSCIVVLGGGLLMWGPMREVALNRVSRHDVFNMKFIQIHGRSSRSFCEGSCIQDGDMGQKGFLMKILI